MSAIFCDATILVMFIENDHPHLNPLCPRAIDFRIMVYPGYVFLFSAERKAQKEGARLGSRTRLTGDSLTLWTADSVDWETRLTGDLVTWLTGRLS